MYEKEMQSEFQRILCAVENLTKINEVEELADRKSVV